ncbi:MAG: SPOR domain-containing protein [Alphaproteobacteria bacterium]
MANDLEALERELTSAPPLRRAKPSRAAGDDGPDRNKGGKLRPQHVDIKDPLGDDDDGEDGLSNPANYNRVRLLVLIAAAFAVVSIGAALWYVYNKGVQSGSETAAPFLNPEQAKVLPESQSLAGLDGDANRIYNRIDGKIDLEPETEQLLPPPEDPMRPISQSQDAQTPAGANSALPPPPSISAPERPKPQVNVITQRPAAAQPPADSALVDPALLNPALVDPELAAPSAPPPTLDLPQISAKPAEDNQQSDSPTPTISAPTTNTPPADTPAIDTPTAGAMQVEENSVNGVAAIPAGGASWRVQIAALRSQGEATAYWQSTRNRFPNLFEGLAFSMEKVVVKGNDFYRVRGGPLPDEQAARRLCDDLMANGQACIIVKPNQ